MGTEEEGAECFNTELGMEVDVYGEGQGAVEGEEGGVGAQGSLVSQEFLTHWYPKSS